ncbi:unnamed protein product [Dracunculus medinensis]|uniref:Large ribosomal subunit protein uL18m n=1 Tax=Dracunculus medinensis TaxID=318479 RepID=A0A0N4U1U0_DRAME|nr:unnamed protein product [Dracunculus medinensis]
MSQKFLKTFINRNPRNLELLGFQAPPKGYDLQVDRFQRSFIHKAQLVRLKNHTEAHLLHYKNGIVLTASTREKAVSNQLHSNIDVTAALNLGRILAIRCLMAGIHFVSIADNEEMIMENDHLKAFYDSMANEGVVLNEPPHIEHNYISDRNFLHDRYIVNHTRLDKTD